MDLLQSNWVAACEKARVPGRSLRVSPKRGARMLAAIAALLVCQLIGEAAVRAVDLPFPGGGRHDPAVRPDADACATPGRARPYRRRSPPASVAAVRAGGGRRGAA